MYSAPRVYPALHSKILKNIAQQYPLILHKMPPTNSLDNHCQTSNDEFQMHQY